MNFLHQTFNIFRFMTRPHSVAQIKHERNINPIIKNLSDLFSDSRFIAKQDTWVHIALEDLFVLLSQFFHFLSILCEINAHNIRVFVRKNNFLFVLSFSEDD